MGQTEPKPARRRICVGVIFGGRSGEHEVSLMSARSVMDALDKDKYDVTAIGIDRSGQWLVGDAMRALQNGDAAAAHPATLLPAPQMAGLLQVEAGAQDSLQPVSLSRAAELDVIFPVLHGPYGEDGTVQGLLELAGLPYVGAGVVGSAVGMDKAVFKQVMLANDIPILPWRLVRTTEWRSQRDAIIAAIEDTFTYPVFTKPANLGSSVGINRCADRDELIAGMDQAARYDRRLIVEQGINARELEVAVLGNDAPIASVVGEVRPRRTFYDYQAKYVTDDSELLIPAPLPSDLAQTAQSLAVKVFAAIDCAGLGRVDLLLDRDTDMLYVNEINTIPGFTRISMYPKLWQASGISYPELLDRLIELALDRHAERAELETSYTQDERDDV
jgi:D-alanine-D-alanine ligase